jgi:hypothetical protein
MSHELAGKIMDTINLSAKTVDHKIMTKITVEALLFHNLSSLSYKPS